MNKFIFVLTYDDVPQKCFTSYKKVVQYLRKEFHQKEYDEAFEWDCLNLIINEEKLEHDFNVHVGFLDDIMIEIYCMEIE